MKSLRDCIGKVYGKLINKTDADRLVLDAGVLQERGLTPIQAERQAVQNALNQVTENGEEILRQIQIQRPAAYQQAQDFWNRETIRKAAGAPPPLPRFVTEAPGAPPQPPPLPAEARPVEAPPPVSEAAAPPAPAPQPPPIPPQPPPLPTEPPPLPISDAAQEVVNSLPEEQRNAAQKAFQRDDRNPLSEGQRRKRLSKPVAPETNTKLIADASKYGVFDKSPAEILRNMASDPKLPRWKRLMADLFIQVGLGEDADIRMVNTPDAHWPALYHFNRETGRGEVLINLSHKDYNGKPLPDLAHRILHELAHHGHLRKLTRPESELTPTELAGKRELEKIFEYVQAHPEDFKGEAAQYGAVGSLEEFAAEIFGNPELQAKLNSIKPDGKVSLWQRFIDSLFKMLIGERGIRKGSMLEKALSEALNVVGTATVETFPPGAVVAPMAAEEHRMKIDREKRQLAEKIEYTQKERTILEGKLSKLLDKKGLKGPERATVEEEYRRQIEDQVRAARAKFSPEAASKVSPSDRWVEIEPKDVELQIEKGRKEQKAKKGRGGKPDTPYMPAIPDSEKAVVTWQEQPYTFDKGTEATQMARSVVDSVKEIVAKSKDPNAEGHENAVIQMRQRGWYRNMTLRLRQEFGGFADLFADLLGALSPNTGVDQNWKFAIIALRAVSQGAYDKELQAFDQWLRAGKTIKDYKESGQPMILQPNGKLFGMNSDKAMKAMLDYWRLIKAGDSPKARNFALNLIGQSNKATIDVWAARFLQRMAGHPRLPNLVERAVAGKHLVDISKVGGAFGFGQEVFRQATEILRKEMPEEFGKLNPPDLQALVWFAEKELWATKDWTSTIGEGGSFEAMADIEMVQRFVVGLSHERPYSVPTAAEQMAASKDLNGKLSAMGKVIASRVKDSYGMFMGTPERSFDVEVLAGPGFDPWEMVLHVAANAAANNQDSTFLSRVIPAKEINGNARPGIEVYFKEDVGPAALNSIMDFLKAKEVDGFTLVVDPRAEERVAKPVQMRGIRFQYIPEFSKDGDKWAEKAAEKEQILREAIDGIMSQEEVASVQLLQYDTLVLTREEDYGNQIDERELSRANVGGSRARVWIERARDAQYSRAIEGGEGGAAVSAPAIPGGRAEPIGSEAAARAPPLEEGPTEEFEREQAAAQAAIDPANDGGIDPPTVAAMSYEDQQEPARDPHGGRASLVRSMVDRLTNGSRDRGGIEIPQSQQEVRGAPDLGGRANPGRKGSDPLWRVLGTTFRKREAELYQKIESAARLIEAENPESERPRDPAKYENSQKLLNYLSGKEVAANPELQAEIAELRKEIPTIPAAKFTSRPLDNGAEADVYHDPNSGVVYKLFGVFNGAIGRKGSYAVGRLSLGSDNEIRVDMGDRATVREHFGRMERANSHGSLTPHELTAITTEGQLVFTQPFVEGRGVAQKNMRGALARAGVHLLTEMGGTSGLAKVDNRWILYDDLHPGNVRTMPGGRVEIIDANNRELDAYEVADLQKLGKLPPEKPLVPTKARAKPTVQKYDNAILVAPMVETYHGTPHEWAPEKKVRRRDGTVAWVPMDERETPDAIVVDWAPEGRVRAEKVGSGEGHAAYGWGVIYAAQAREVAEGYRETLSEDKWFIDGEDIDTTSAVKGDEYWVLNRALKRVEDPADIDASIDRFRRVAERDERYAARLPEMGKEAKDYREMADALEKFKGRVQFRKGAGNIYTLQLDVNDPELLDWFKPMKEQMWIFDRVAEKFGASRESATAAYEENERLADEANNLQRTHPDSREHAEAEKRWEEHHKQPAVTLGSMLRRIEKGTTYGAEYTGEKFYQNLAFAGNKTKRDASEFLNSVGVPGIVFLDQESRRTEVFPATNEEGLPKWIVTVQGQPYGKNQFDTEAEARAFAKTKTTNNYVMFDPERIKVVAKNGQVVRTVAADMPAPVTPKYEPVTVAAMAEEDIRDDRDLTVAPMAGAGKRARKDINAENYKRGGWFAPFKRLSWEVGKFVQQKHQQEAAAVYRIQRGLQNFERTLKRAYKGKPSPEENRNIMLALGNLDNRITQDQANEARKLKGADREAFLHTAHLENVAQFKQRQEAALNALPEEIRKAVNVLREELNRETKETLKDTGLDTELRARLDANQNVFLHANAFQHFENKELWGKHIRSDDPEAARISGAAKNLFRNEIVAENALAYQNEQKKKDIDVSDEDALAFARAAGDLDDQVETRMDDYLSKEADTPTRMHMLMGKMRVGTTQAGKMLSLDRENIPQEIRELWGQYNDPATNFAKTLSILANHNAQTRMQNAMLADGLEKGYFWKQDVSLGATHPPGLVKMTTETHGPLVGVWGPPELKEGLTLMNQPQVRSLMSEMNSIPLLMKTVGSVGSAVRNFFGNPLFMVSNGNLLLSAVYWRKAFWLSTQRAADFMASPTAAGQKQLARMIELGVLDENVDSNILKRIAKNAGVAEKWQNEAGFASSVGAMQRSFVQRAQTGLGAIATPFQKFYTMADNFWRLANYNVELARQKWMNPDLSLEQQEENAAEITRRTLPTYSNIPEGFRESYGKLRDVAAPYLSFQAEAMRTYASTWALAARELRSSNPKEKVSGTWRLLGLMAATTAPITLAMLSKWKFDYDDDDEKAIRDGLPEYKRNNMLFFLKRDADGAPRYLDLNFMNPYSMVHTAATAGWRGEGVGGAAKQLVKPLASAQPVAGLAMELLTGKDRFGRDIYDPYASWDQQTLSILGRFGKYYIPGTASSVFNIAEAHMETDLLGSRRKTGEVLEPLQEWMKLFPGAPIETLDRKKAMNVHIGEHKKAARNASGLFNETISAKGSIGEGEVKAAYLEADERNYRAFEEMHKAYRGLLKLGMSEEDAIKQMVAGFGDEIATGGLSKTVIDQIVTGNYRQFIPSEKRLQSAAAFHPERITEFGEVFQTRAHSRTARP